MKAPVTNDTPHTCGGPLGGCRACAAQQMQHRLQSLGPRASNPLEEEILGPVHATMRWKGPEPLDKVRSTRREPPDSHQGGVYILVNGFGQVLKAGSAHDFATRVAKYKTLRKKETNPRLKPEKIFLGDISIDGVPASPPSRNFQSVALTVERVITRTLHRLISEGVLPSALSPSVSPGDVLPLEKQSGTKAPNPVIHNIKISNLLPPALVDEVKKGYRNLPTSRSSSKSAQATRSRMASIVGGGRDLRISQKDQPLWEVDP